MQGDYTSWLLNNLWVDVKHHKSPRQIPASLTINLGVNIMEQESISDRCADCVYLVEMNHAWFCENYDCFCKEIVYCKEFETIKRKNTK